MVRSGPERAGRGLTWTAILPALNPLLPPPSPRRHHHAALPSSPRRPPAIATPSSRPRHAAIATPPSPYRPHHGCRRKPAPQPRPPPPVRRARGGVLGWMRLMDGSAPQYTLRHLSIWSLNLYPGRNFSIAANRQAALSRASPSLPCLCDPCNACLWSCDVRWSGRCAHATRRRRCADVIREDACMPRMYHRVWMYVCEHDFGFVYPPLMIDISSAE